MALWWLDLDQRPRIVLNGGGKVLWCNKAARGGLRSGSPLHVENDRLVIGFSEHAGTVRQLLRAANTDVQRITLKSGSDNLDSVTIGVWGTGAGAERRVFVKIMLLAPALSAQESGMAAHYSLTPAEAGVVDAMLQVDSPTAIATLLGVSVHTVRSHMQRIYAKVGVGTQAQLTRLALVFCGG